MPSVLEKLIVDVFRNSTPPELLLAGIILALLLWTSYRIHKALNNAYTKEQEQNERIAVLEKQQSKLITTLNCAPCISKTNSLWLADKRRNGGQPPESIVCKYEGRAIDDD